MLFTIVLLTNYCISSFAHVIPQIEDTSAMRNQPNQMKVAPLIQEMNASQSPSPGHHTAASKNTNHYPYQMGGDQLTHTQRRARIEFIKQKVLNQLHLSEPPNASEPIRLLPPEILQSLADHKNKHHLQRQHLEDDPETTKVFVTAEINGRINCDMGEGSHCFKFQFQRRSHDERLIAVRLWIYLQPDEHSSTLEVQQRTIVATLPASHYGRRHVLATKQTYIQQGWIEIEFSQRHHIMKLFNDTWNFIELSCLEIPRGNFISTTSSSTPILSLTYGFKRRSRRQSNPTDNTGCRLVPFSMTFSELNWNWIRPGAFRADFCVGTCGPSDTDNARTQIISTFNHVNGGGVTGLGTACCVPLSYANLTVFYSNSSPRAQTQMVIHNLRATSCGCIV